MSYQDYLRAGRPTSGRTAEPPPAPAQAVPVAFYGREPVEWLLPGRVPKRAVCVLAGDPGLGKSLWACALAGEVSRAGGGVLLATAEDSIPATVRPRLEAVEADLQRVHIVSLKRDGIEEGLSLPDDVPELDRLVTETQAQLVVIDPLMAHLPDNVNSWRDQSVRRALAPLHHLAEAHGCAVVVVAHLNKAQGNEALYRIGGSIGIGGAARSVLLFARDPDDPDGDQGRQRVLAHVKCNVGALAPALAYRVEPTLLPGDEPIKTARVVAHGEIEATGAQLLARHDQDDAPARTEAEEFLAALLEDGPVEAKRVVREAAEAGISKRTLDRAKGKLGVRSRQAEGARHRGWVWALGNLTPDGGNLTATEPNPHISGNGNLTGEGGNQGVRLPDCHAEKEGRPPPRVHQVWLYPDAPDRRFRVLEVADRVKVRVESSNGDTGALLEFPVAAFGEGLRRRS